VDKDTGWDERLPSAAPRVKYLIFLSYLIVLNSFYKLTPYTHLIMRDTTIDYWESSGSVIQQAWDVCTVANIKIVAIPAQSDFEQPTECLLGDC
jgi:hypothetical protein